MFSLVGRLPSMPSANGFPLLFGHFVGTVRPSDSPSTCMLDFWFMTFSNRPAHEIVTGVAGVSRFSRMEFPCMLGFSDCAEPFGSLRWRFHRYGLPSRWTTSAFRIHLFRSSISRLHVPLIVTLGKVSVREISTVVVARACLWKCEKFEFADRLHWRRQASGGHEYVPLTLDVY